MKKRIVSILLALVLLVAVLPQISLPASAKLFSGECGAQGANLIWFYESDTGAMSITGSGAMRDYYDASYAPWLEYAGRMTSVELPIKATNVGHHAFENCTRLELVRLPGGLRSIGKSSFERCVSLELIGLPDTITKIDKRAFFSCLSLTSVELPAGLIELGESAFEHCVMLKEAVIPGKLSVIPERAFADCFSLSYVNIQPGVTTIGYDAFVGCNALTSITIPKSVKTIANGSLGYSCDQKTGKYYKTEGFTIWGVKYSAAYDYALRNGFRFVDLATGLTYFTDVSSTAYYAAAVDWAVKNNITNGMTANTFNPDGLCTRGQIVTFLWRCKGSPAVAPFGTSFTDINANAFYYTAMLWAVKNNITTGTSATTFEPNSPCTRAQVVTFLWRAEGEPEPAVLASSGETSVPAEPAEVAAVEENELPIVPIDSEEPASDELPVAPVDGEDAVPAEDRGGVTTSPNPFTDVADDAYYYKAVLWALEKGIATGMTATTFGPNRTCTRAQAVTFLYRAYK